ncbi:MAG TPA: DUF4163 domain-containing protein, partial [Croceibacterium sp.]|nr:DUF4163 domain-containing protein [Croceibacterium sp.]
MRRLLSLWVLGAALAGCNGEGGADPAATATATPTPTASATATATSSGARSVAEETDDFLFEYSYPAEAGRITALATLLDVWLEQRREELAGESVAARREARQQGFPYNKHSYTAEWKVVADLPGWLSLSADVATYSGGAHGNYTVDSLVWDKEKGAAIDAKKLFVSPAALEQSLGERFCDALDREREKRRGAPLDQDESGNSFVDCPKIGELEVLVGSSNRRTFDRLTIYAGPY